MKLNFLSSKIFRILSGIGVLVFVVSYARANDIPSEPRDRVVSFYRDGEPQSVISLDFINHLADVLCSADYVAIVRFTNKFEDLGKNSKSGKSFIQSATYWTTDHNFNVIFVIDGEFSLVKKLVSEPPLLGEVKQRIVVPPGINFGSLGSVEKLNKNWDKFRNPIEFLAAGAKGSKGILSAQTFVPLGPGESGAVESAAHYLQTYPMDKITENKARDLLDQNDSGLVFVGLDRLVLMERATQEDFVLAYDHLALTYSRTLIDSLIFYQHGNAVTERLVFLLENAESAHRVAAIEHLSRIYKDSVDFRKIVDSNKKLQDILARPPVTTDPAK